VQLRISSQIQAVDSYRQYGIGKGSAAARSDGVGLSHSVGSYTYGTAALSLSGRVPARSSGLTEASKRAQESISQLQSADAALQKADAALGRMRELAVISANVATPDAERIVLDYEFTRYKFEFSRNCTLSFSGVDFSKSSVSAVMSEPISVDAIGDIKSMDSARSAVSAIGNALDEIASSRVKIGEAQSKLINDYQSSGNVQNLLSRVRDSSAAVKLAEQVQRDMASSPSRSMLAHANALPQAVLQLLN